MRIDGWDTVLLNYVKSCRKRDFEWGAFDCCLFVADALLSITGVDYAADFRGKYDSEIGAKRLLEERGGFIETMCGLFGSEEVPVSFVHRGDPVMINTETGPALGICLGAISYFVASSGLSAIPTSKCVAGWRVK